VCEGDAFEELWEGDVAFMRRGHLLRLTESWQPEGRYPTLGRMPGRNILLACGHPLIWCRCLVPHEDLRIIMDSWCSSGPSLPTRGGSTIKSKTIFPRQCEDGLIRRGTNGSNRTTRRRLGVSQVHRAPLHGT